MKLKYRVSYGNLKTKYGENGEDLNHGACGYIKIDLQTSKNRSTN